MKIQNDSLRAQRTYLSCGNFFTKMIWNYLLIFINAWTEKNSKHNANPSNLKKNTKYI